VCRVPAVEHLSLWNEFGMMTPAPI